MAQGETNNYTLGRGEIYVARYVDNDSSNELEGERYIGNSPEFSLTISQETLDHFSSDRGIREKDESIALQVNRTGQMVTDNIVPKNVSLFFFGEDSEVVDAGGAVNGEVVGGTGGVKQGYYYQLGLSDARPAGARGLVGDTDDSNSAGAFALYENDSNSSGGAEYAAGTDYEIDFERGRLYIKPGGTIADGTVLSVNYIVRAQTFERVISGSQPVAAALRYLAQNPTGDDIDYYMPYVKISPNGDYALKSDEWQQIPFSIEVLKLTNREAIYADGEVAFT